MNTKKIITLEFSKSNFPSKINKAVADDLGLKESTSVLLKKTAFCAVFFNKIGSSCQAHLFRLHFFNPPKNIMIPNLLKKTAQNIGSSCQAYLHFLRLQYGSTSDDPPT
ncbi:hypothetical protein AGMMS49921_02550 [Endomicrobiia bacterium]|nr:hypothetical protein AGMMS49921_02550 [Endomicrobiia bacterium]